MANDAVKTRILDKGSEIIHQKGYKNTSINEICSAAGIPKGSFYYYFRTKEDFVRELIDYYYGFMFSVQDRHLNMGSVTSYIERLRGYYEEFRHYFLGKNCSGGCPIGNLAQELSDCSEPLRKKLQTALEDTKRNIALFLKKAQDNGEIAKEHNTDELADFIFNSWEGSLLRMKVTKSMVPMELFEKMVFDVLLNSCR